MASQPNAMLLPHQVQKQQQQIRPQLVQVMNAQQIAQLQAHQAGQRNQQGQQFLAAQPQFVPINNFVAPQQIMANANGGGFALRQVVPTPRPMIRAPKLATVQTYAPYQQAPLSTAQPQVLPPTHIQLMQQQQQQQAQAHLIQQQQAQMLQQQQQNVAQATFAQQQQQAVMAGLQAQFAASNNGHQQQQYWVQNAPQSSFTQMQPQQQQYVLINGQPVLIQQQQQQSARSTVFKVPVMQQQQQQHMQPANYAALVGRGNNVGGGMLLDLSSLHAMQAMPGGGGSAAPSPQIQHQQHQQLRRSFSGAEPSGGIPQGVVGAAFNLKPHQYITSKTGSVYQPFKPTTAAVNAPAAATPPLPFAAGLQQLGGGAITDGVGRSVLTIERLVFSVSESCPSSLVHSSELRALLTCIGTELSRHGIEVTDAVHVSEAGSRVDLNNLSLIQSLVHLYLT